MPRRNYRTKPKLVKQVYQTGCTKQRFATKQLAEQAAQTQMLANQNIELGTYQCPFCAGWHLTHKSD